MWEYFVWNIRWTKITYDTPKFDIKDIKIRFVHDESRNHGKIVVHFPALEKFTVHAIQNVDSWTFPNDEKLTVELSDFNIDFSANLFVNYDGNLKPRFF